MACVDLAQIVASQSFTAQTSALSATTIYAPSAAGFFRLNVYVDGNNGNDVGANVQFTDDRSNAQNAAITFLQNGLWLNSVGDSGSLYGVTAFRSKASVAISVSTTFFGSGSYDLYVVLEQLA